ncbi:hypothetical protein Pan161_21430 [Gimesia algae]|uniref:Uncharacterized protein n=1 Tax=Gimesia algae TaxID=2527971 RepID=A0A517VBX1_9PLAN|nr:hypothetical protein Pan161_21430 [Gimesia algae]
MKPDRLPVQNLKKMAYDKYVSNRNGSLFLNFKQQLEPVHNSKGR